MDDHVRQSGTGHGHVLLFVRNIPDDDNVAEALRIRPECAELLAWWRDAWHSILPTLSPPITPYSESDAGSHEFRGTRTNDEDVVWEGFPGGTLALAAFAERMRELHAAVAPGERDWRHHVVEDADSLRAVSTDALPYRATFVVAGQPLTFVRNGADGFPILARMHDLPWEERIRIEAVMEDWYSDPMLYWNMPGFMKHAERDFAECPQPASAAYSLLAMARRGDRKAFAKGIRTKTGTWTIDLAGVVDAKTAWSAIAGAMWPAVWQDDGIVLQEHLPCPEEQRFFVVGGRIAGSVCSDRNLSRPDARKGRILDDRVAVLARPEIDAGIFDRGHTGHRTDRRMAAAMARKARAVARDLSTDGVLDYVLDVGMTERGPVAIELNTLAQAGPYCLDRRLHVRAAMKTASSWRTPPVAETVHGDLLPDPDDVLDAAILAMSKEARVLSSVPFVAFAASNRPRPGRFHVFLCDGRIGCLASTIEDGRTKIQPVASSGGNDRSTAGEDIARRRPSWPEDAQASRILFDDGTVRLHAALEDGDGSRLLVLTRSTADREDGSLRVDVPGGTVFADHASMDPARGPTNIPTTTVRWSKVASMTYTMSKTPSGKTVQWSIIDVDETVS